VNFLRPHSYSEAELGFKLNALNIAFHAVLLLYPSSLSYR
jgi:hypothetical protein